MSKLNSQAKILTTEEHTAKILIEVGVETVLFSIALDGVIKATEAGTTIAQNMTQIVGWPSIILTKRDYILKNHYI